MNVWEVKRFTLLFGNKHLWLIEWEHCGCSSRGSTWRSWDETWRASMRGVTGMCASGGSSESAEEFAETQVEVWVEEQFGWRRLKRRRWEDESRYGRNELKCTKLQRACVSALRGVSAGDDVVGCLKENKASLKSFNVECGFIRTSGGGAFF